METANKTTQPEKDAVLAKLESMLGNMPESSKQPILDLIHRRKVELGLEKSGLPPAGYKLKKSHAKPKTPSKERQESLKKLAKTVGSVKVTTQTVPQDIDIKEEPLKKDKNPVIEADSYKH